MLYGYICRVCRQPYDSTTYGQTLGDCKTPSCTGTITRDYSNIAVKPGMPDHFNATVNQPISSAAQFRSALSRKGEEYTVRTGIEVDYQPVDLNDHAALGVTEEGLDATNRSRVAQGKPAIRL